MKRIWMGAVALAMGLSGGAWLLGNGHQAEASGNAGFSLAPTSGTYGVGNTVTVTVSESSTAGDNVNAVQVNLTFPAALLSWQSTNLNGPFTLCAQNSHGSGTVNLACAATTAQSGSQSIATVSFTVLAGGSAQVALANGSDIDNTSGSSVWNGVLPGVTYTLNGPAPATPTPAPSGNKTTTAAKNTAAKTGATPTPSGSPAASATPSASASPSPSSSPAATSGGSGSLSVTVSDASGRVSGATVDLDGQFATTNSSGVANFSGISSGSHSLTITAAGDKSFSTTVSIDPGQNALVSFKLTKTAGTSNGWLVWVLLGGAGVLVVTAGSFGAVQFIRSRRTPFTNLPAASAVPVAPVAPVANPAPLAQPPVQAPAPQPMPAQNPPSNPTPPPGSTGPQP